GPLRLRSVVRLGGNLHLAHGIALDAKVAHDTFLKQAIFEPAGSAPRDSTLIVRREPFADALTLRFGLLIRVRSYTVAARNGDTPLSLQPANFSCLLHLLIFLLTANPLPFPILKPHAQFLRGIKQGRRL